MKHKLLQECIELLGWGVPKSMMEEVDDEPDNELDPVLYKKVLERLKKTDQSFAVDIEDLLNV
jgi:hypothetical protein